MAFQTNVLQDGQWVTQTVDLRTVIEANDDPQARPEFQSLHKPATCGVLTRTVIESPVVHWILPARLRSMQNNDVAFIGDNRVEIREFRSDDQFHDVIKKIDFPSRIRNARVLGSITNGRQTEDPMGSPKVKFEDTDDRIMVGMDEILNNSSHHVEADTRQGLLLVFETGDCMVLFLRQGEDGRPEFVMACQESFARQDHLMYLGHHLTIEPSSRYVALGCPEGLFVVYELHSLENMYNQALGKACPSPFRSYRPRSVGGVIHKMEFLHPTQGQTEHVILLLIIVQDGYSRMVTYDWEVGDSLESVLSGEKKGYRLWQQGHLPLFIVPLTVMSSFLIVTPTKVIICKGFMHSDALYDDFGVQVHPPQQQHMGKELPLWTAWTRPIRLPGYSRGKDCIYLAREDGYVVYLEIARDGTVEGSIAFQQFNCNIDTGFCSIFEKSSDILVMAGDSGSGELWKVAPRLEPVYLGNLQNWSPILDFTFMRARSPVGLDSRYRAPDRIFATSGRGRMGSITELRYGLTANIGLELESPPYARQVWMLPALDLTLTGGRWLLYALQDRTAILHLSEDLADLSDPPEEDLNFDVASTTLAAHVRRDQHLVQVTSTATAIVTHSHSVIFEHSSLVPQGEWSISAAAVDDDWIALAAAENGLYSILVLAVGTDGAVTFHQSYRCDGEIGKAQSDGANAEITCLEIADVFGDRMVIAAMSTSEGPIANAVSIRSGKVQQVLRWASDEEFNTGGAASGEDQTLPGQNSITSIALMSVDESMIACVFGSRNGTVTTIPIHRSWSQISEAQIHQDTLGISTAAVVGTIWQSRPAVLVTCDLGTTIFSHYDRQRAQFRQKHRVWPVDAAEMGANAPPIDHALVIKPGISDDEKALPLLLLSGAKTLITEVRSTAGAVPRTLTLNCLPNKVLYSQQLDCLLVTGVSEEGPKLVFLDPNTGENLGKATDKDGKEVPRIGGLTHSDDKIFGLSEWEYASEGRSYYYILVSTKDGRLIVISTVVEVSRDATARRQIRYWTRWREPKADAPIYCVLGTSQGIAYCVGSDLHLAVLDPNERRLTRVKTYTLNSPATSLRCVADGLTALTIRDGLYFLDYSGQVDSEGPGKMAVIAVNYGRRELVHQVVVGHGGDPASLVALVSDREGTVTGLDLPYRSAGKNCEAIFQAELPASIRKFRRGSIRPIWARRNPSGQFGMADYEGRTGSEIYGIAMDGTLVHFTLLNQEGWELLRFVENAARLSRTLSPLLSDKAKEIQDENPVLDNGLGMQVDGDFLQPILDGKLLERVLTRPAQQARLAELLDEIDNGRSTAAFEDGDDMKKREQYFRLAYTILEQCLAPLL